MGGYYTQKDIKDIIAIRSFRNIEVIPEIDMPGHMMVATTAYSGTFTDERLPMGQTIFRSD